MADNERRAEIEAARELLRAWDARELPHPEHPATHWQWSAWMNEAADRLRSILNRVRDARGDDEVVCPWGPPATCKWGDACADCGTVSARSPQDEDHKPCPTCGDRGWHTAGGNDPMACGRCPAGEAWSEGTDSDGTVAVEDVDALSDAIYDQLKHPGAMIGGFDKTTLRWAVTEALAEFSPASTGDREEDAGDVSS